MQKEWVFAIAIMSIFAIVNELNKHWNEKIFKKLEKILKKIWKSIDKIEYMN